MKVSRTTVSDWIRDKHGLRIDKVSRLAAILDVDPSGYEVTVGQRIAKRLRELDLNQAQLAQLMKVSCATVSDWISDKHGLRIDKVPRLAAILDVDPATLSPYFRAVRRSKRK